MDEATCPGRAFKIYGKDWTIRDIVAKACEDRPFYEASGGGVTISGGEPLLFPEWTVELLRALRAEGLHTCVDTSLYAAQSVIESLLPLADMWLPDFKVADDVQHRRLTGVSNEPIKRNLARLVAAGAQLEVRCVSVPGLTDGADLVARHDYLHSLAIPEASIVDLEYHDYARSKYLALGMPDTMPPR